MARSGAQLGISEGISLQHIPEVPPSDDEREERRLAAIRFMKERGYDVEKEKAHPDWKNGRVFSISDSVTI